MSDTLPVHLNRDGTQDVEAAPSFEATDSFAVLLHNHGSPAHVHLRLSDDLADVTTLGTTNYYVESDSIRRVEVTVESGRRPIEGSLEVVTRFGANAATVAVDLVEPAETENAVHVDESLGRPDEGDLEPEPDPAVPPWLVEEGPVVALAALAVILAVVAVMMSDTLALVVGLVIVVAGAGVALAFLRQPE